MLKLYRGSVLKPTEIDGPSIAFAPKVREKFYIEDKFAVTFSNKKYEIIDRVNGKLDFGNRENIFDILGNEYAIDLEEINRHDLNLIEALQYLKINILYKKEQKVKKLTK